MTNFIFNSEINFLNKYYDKCFSIFKLKSYFKFLNNNFLNILTVNIIIINYLINQNNFFLFKKNFNFII